MRHRMVATAGGRTAKRQTRSSRGALLALGLVMLVGLSALSGAGGIVGSATATHTISECGVYEESDHTYALAGIEAAGNSPCIQITGDDVVLDGSEDASITAADSQEVGVLVTGEDVTVKDLDVNDFRTGVEYTRGASGTVENVDVTGALDAGIVVESSTVDITGSSVTNPAENPGSTGILVDSESAQPTTITDTAVRNTDTGVRASQAGLETTGLDVRSNARGLVVNGPGQVHTNLVAVDNDLGVHVMGTEEVPHPRSASEVAASDEVTIEDATIEGGGVESNDVGIVVERMEDRGVTIRNAAIENVAGGGIRVHSSDATIDGSGTTITGSGEGIVAASCRDECYPGTVRVSDATVSGDRMINLVARGDATLAATDVDVGASTAPKTTIDADLRRAGLVSLDSFEEATVPDAPDGREALGRYVAIVPATGEGGIGVPAAGDDGVPTDGDHEVSAEANDDGTDERNGGEPAATLTLQYEDEDVTDLDESTVTMLRLGPESEGWEPVEDTLDRGDNDVRATVSSSGMTGYGLFAEPAPEPTPTPAPEPDQPVASGGGSTDPGTPDISIADATISDETVTPGDTVSVAVTLANDGDSDGTETVNLTVDGDVVDSQAVLVRSNDSRTFDFAYTIDSEGEYAFAADDESAGTVTAAADEPTTDSTDGSSADETETSTPAETATPTPTATPTDDTGGAAPTPDDAEGGGLGVFVIVGMVAVIGGIVGGGWLLTREDR